jgi:predicted phosphodiesterase
MSFLYTEHIKRIEIPSYKNKTDLWLFGDVHRDTQSCEVERWHDWLKKARNTDAYYISMGDTHDFASASEKKSLQKADLHETTLEKFDQIVTEMNRKFCGEIGFMRDKLLCMVDGNHNWLLANGKTSTDDLAERMNSISVGWLCHYTWLFSFKDHGKGNNLAIRFVLCHGKAGGKTAGITITQVDDLKRVFPVADVYVMGHDHQRGAWPVSVLVPSQSTNEIKQKRQLLCRSGSFKKAYVDGHASYEVGKLFKPSDLGALKLTISFNRSQKNGTDILSPYIEATI